MTTLENLYYGNINPIDKCFDRDSEYGRALKTLADNEEKLLVFLSALPNSEGEKRLFEQMMAANAKTSDFTACEKFIDGFRLGAGIILEAFVSPTPSVIRDLH